jgi:hypothetical protein
LGTIVDRSSIAHVGYLPSHWRCNDAGVDGLAWDPLAWVSQELHWQPDHIWSCRLEAGLWQSFASVGSCISCLHRSWSTPTALLWICRQHTDQCCGSWIECIGSSSHICSPLAVAVVRIDWSYWSINHHLLRMVVSRIVTFSAECRESCSHSWKAATQYRYNHIGPAFLMPEWKNGHDTSKQQQCKCCWMTDNTPINTMDHVCVHRLLQVICMTENKVFLWSHSERNTGPRGCHTGWSARYPLNWMPQEARWYLVGLLVTGPIGCGGWVVLWGLKKQQWHSHPPVPFSAMGVHSCFAGSNCWITPWLRTPRSWWNWPSWSTTCPIWLQGWRSGAFWWLWQPCRKIYHQRSTWE